MDVDNSCVDYAAGLVAVDCAAEGECSQDLVCVIRREDGKRYYGSSSCFEQLRDRWSLCPVTEDESLRAACGAGGEGGAAGAN